MRVKIYKLSLAYVRGIGDELVSSDALDSLGFMACVIQAQAVVF
jgi:hypothetical protein